MAYKTLEFRQKDNGGINMKSGDIRKWKNVSACKNLLFFSELVNELLFDYSIPSNRISTLNSHFLCYDALNAINGIECNGVPEGTLKPIVEELYSALLVDPIFQDEAPSPLDYFLKTENNKYRVSTKVSELNYNEMKNAVISIDTMFFQKNNYYDKLKQRIITIIEDNDETNQLELFRLVKSLLTEIINIGYTSQYIYHIMSKYFWNPQSDIESPNQISCFFDSFSFKKKEFSVAFIVEDRKIYQFIKFIEGISIEKSINPISNSRKEKQFLRIKSNESFVIIKRNAFDYYAAAQKARNLLSFNVSVYRLYDHDYKYSFNTISCGVYDGTSFYRISSPKSAVEHTRKPSDERIKKNMDDLSSLIEKAIDSRRIKVVTTLNKAIEFHAHSLDSLSKENQLLDFWAIFESVLDISNKHTSDRINQVCTYLVPILKRKYIYSLFQQLAFDIKTYSETEYLTIIGDATEETEIIQKICEFVLTDEYKTQREGFINNCSDFPLLQERINYYASKLTSTKDIYDFVEKHAERVKWQIMRIYRNRNLIVHNGKSMPYLNLLIENLHSYVDDFIEYVIKSLNSGHTIESMCQELYIKECNWNSKYSRKKKDLDTDIIKELLSY